MRLLVFVIVIFNIFQPRVGSIIYISSLILLDAYVVLMNRSRYYVNNETGKYTEDEIKVIERYPLFFEYPFASRSLSAAFSGIQLSTFILVPWYLYNELYLGAILVGLNYFIASQLSVKLNPQFFLHDNIDKKKIKDRKMEAVYRKDMEAIDSALEKMYLDSKLG